MVTFGVYQMMCMLVLMVFIIDFYTFVKIYSGRERMELEIQLDYLYHKLRFEKGLKKILSMVIVFQGFVRFLVFCIMYLLVIQSWLEPVIHIVVIVYLMYNIYIFHKLVLMCRYVKEDYYTFLEKAENLMMRGMYFNIRLYMTGIFFLLELNVLLFLM